MASSYTYLPQLDGMRAIAIASVLISHFLPSDYLANRLLHLGRLGVVMFFVLSGFLITGILLRYREQSLMGTITRPQYFRVFYVRRMLRIFPIYYLVIGAGILVGFGPVRQYWYWHVTYLSNLAAGFLGIDFGVTAHLWSLCVEEQFYLIWPLMVLLASRRALLRIALFLIVGSIAFKLIGGMAGLGWRGTNFATFGCLDSLGLGAMLAILRHERSDWPHWVKSCATYSLAFGLLLALALEVFRFIEPSDVREYFLYQGMIDLGFGLVSVSLVNAAANNSTYLIGRVLQSGPLVYIGKISYGIYLYHPFLRAALPRFLQQLGISIPLTGFGTLFFYSAMSIALAAISWHFFEKPINNLKEHFAPARQVLEVKEYSQA